MNNSNSNPIAFFDSGIGGLSVYSRFMNKLPTENTIYFADLKNLPYGTKSPEELIKLARKILDFFKTQNVKAVAIACNTSSAVAYEVVKAEYDFEIYPVLQICSRIVSMLNYKKIGVFATQATVNSKAYSTNIKSANPNISVCEIACPNWVDFIERRELDTLEAKKDFEEKMQAMQNFKPEKIILGCTHYPVILDYFVKEEEKSLFLNQAEVFVDYIISDLRNNNILNKDYRNISSKFYVTDNADKFSKNAELFYKLKEKPTLVDI